MINLESTVKSTLINSILTYLLYLEENGTHSDVPAYLDLSEFIGDHLPDELVTTIAENMPLNPEWIETVMDHESF